MTNDMETLKDLFIILGTVVVSCLIMVVINFAIYHICRLDIDDGEETFLVLATLNFILACAFSAGLILILMGY